MKKTGFIAFAMTIAFAASAQAAIVGGAITGGTAPGTFVELTVPFTESDPDNTVGNNTFQRGNLYAFFEGTFTVGADLALDIGGVSAGDVIESYYVFFDPRTSKSLEAYVDFSTEILGVATSLASLNATDIFGAPSVTYLSPNLRGLEANDSAALSGLQRVVLDWKASTPGDYIRVLTVSEVPLPAAAWVFLAGLGGIAAKTRRKKAAA